MKTKSHPRQINSGNYLEQALMKGLTKSGRQWAKGQVKKFEGFGIAVPWGLIRNEAVNR